jgi:hypothetical protein
MVGRMTEEIGIGLAAAMMVSMAFRSRAEVKRRQDDPEYAAKVAARELLKAEEKYNAIYEQAAAENAEYERSPRAFIRRLSKSKV